MLIKSTPSERAASSAERQTLFRLPSSRRCTGARRDGDAWRIQSTSPIESWPPSEARSAGSSDHRKRVKRDAQRFTAWPRSEERRVGKGWVRTCRSRWSPYHTKKNTMNVVDDHEVAN